ncbi:MAG: hypothetical protein US50_C0019G0015 [Candidatus Nomurabacteria bacterium GW2011_GWB1_37_5]|uniref:Uncharacterized protein n=1 Tax=Candidatus Nomurabacteria bacterium GW2011_GWB1_37_5 TaxID=1618742 RepID=A0A0G0GWC7_9BACT|nr:MAG: hypothetical protein US50_C0019G0015 [Candidatus Nomurabacteria bacterium GW2011_GWB1_37_5]
MKNQIKSLEDIQKLAEKLSMKKYTQHIAEMYGLTSKSKEEIRSIKKDKMYMGLLNDTELGGSNLAHKLREGQVSRLEKKVKSIRGANDLQNRMIEIRSLHDSIPYWSPLRKRLLKTIDLYGDRALLMFKTLKRMKTKQLLFFAFNAENSTPEFVSKMDTIQHKIFAVMLNTENPGAYSLGAYYSSQINKGSLLEKYLKRMMSVTSKPEALMYLYIEAPIGSKVKNELRKKFMNSVQ